VVSEPATMAPPPLTSPQAVDLAVCVGALELGNPILSASGTFGYGLEFAHLAPLEQFGGIVTKGLSLEPLRGNPPHRICETASGMLNSIGLQNIGIRRFLDHVLPGLADYPAKVVVNLFGTTPDEYVRLAELVEPQPGIAAIELNVSCPNVKRGGIQFGHDPELLGDLVRRIRVVTSKPLIVKLSPNVTTPAEIALAARQAGADALSAINTLVGMAIDTRTRRPRLHTVKGGLSGPAIKPIALRIVFDVARASGLPVIGIGGIETVDDVLEFLLAGASAVQVGTALFRDPRTAARLVDDLRQRLFDDGIASARELIGGVLLEPGA
jgi:dihydroorotate dehydrogenase (NAD+) catalytic subunit